MTRGVKTQKNRKQNVPPLKKEGNKLISMVVDAGVCYNIIYM